MMKREKQTIEPSPQPSRRAPPLLAGFVILLLLVTSCASDASEDRQQEVLGAQEAAESSEDLQEATYGPEDCHALESPEACNAFEGPIEFLLDDLGNSSIWPRCGWFAFLSAGPESTCLAYDHGICVPAVSGGMDAHQGWVRLGESGYIGYLPDMPYTVFPPKYHGATYALPTPPDFQYPPLTDTQRALMEMDRPPICP